MANIELRYGSEKHDRIRDAIRARIEHAEHAVGKRTEEYAENEERYMMYMPTTDADARRKTKRDNGEPQYTNIDVPFSYAVLLSWHTYIATTFLGRSPIQQFSARHGESEMQIQAVEAIMDYQTQVGKHLMPYYLWILDAGKYGVGVLWEYWDEEVIQVSTIEEKQETYLGIPLSGRTKKVKTTKRVPGYRGNKVFNVRPQDFIYDSRVSLMNFQEGEFCGRFTDIPWNKLIKGQEAGQYYNIEALRTHKKNNKSRKTSTATRDTGSSQLELPDAIMHENTTLWDDLATPDYSEAVELVVELIPKDWELGSSTYPEKWMFTLADDEVIIESQPQANLHGDFPCSVLEYEIEAYGLHKRGMLEILDPLNDTLTWLMNSHMYNVRSVLNGQFVMDPSRINIKDFKSDGGGRIARLLPTAYGQDPKTTFTQIPTVDVTGSHLKDMQILMDLIQRVSGVTENIMGMVNPGGRKTAHEIRSSNTFGTNRIKTHAEIFSATGFSLTSARMLQNTQQFYDQEQQFKIAGDLLEGEAVKFANVTPESIAGFFDFVPVDGTMPVDRFAQVTLWTQLLGQMRQFPEVMSSYDMGGIFAWVAQLGGLKNIKRFRVNVRPDGDIARDLQAGNVVGLDDVRGNTGGNGGTPQNSTGVPGAAQFPGLGPSG